MTTSMAVIMPHIVLWYLGTEHGYDRQTIINSAWQPDWYHIVWRCPVAEMLTKTPPDLAEELLKLVSSAEWVKQFKRPMRLGDRFTLEAEGTDWFFAKTTDTPQYTTAGLATHKLPAWPDTTIVQGVRTT